MLVGNILSVSGKTVATTAVLYAAVGLFHFIFRKKFLAVSMGEEIPNLKLWDFLFYTSFGFVVTSSVAIAGVLLVFSYLIVPSVGAMLFSQSIGKRLAIGWTMGALVSALGILMSFRLDLPTGATIVCTFGITLALMAAVWAVTKRRTLIAE
jgi:zinc/manganese transport system permease protein